MKKEDLYYFAKSNSEITPILKKKVDIINKIYYKNKCSYYEHFEVFHNYFEVELNWYYRGDNDYLQHQITFDEFFMDDADFENYLIEKKNKEDEERKLRQEEQRKQKQQKEKEDLEAWERAQYLRLKEKYEGK